MVQKKGTSHRHYCTPQVPPPYNTTCFPMVFEVRRWLPTKSLSKLCQVNLFKQKQIAKRMNYCKVSTDQLSLRSLSSDGPGREPFNPLDCDTLYTFTHWHPSLFWKKYINCKILPSMSLLISNKISYFGLVFWLIRSNLEISFKWI